MKLKGGDMLVMDARNGTLSLQIIGRNDVPRVEREGRGWRDGATALLKGTDVAEFLDMISGVAGGREIGDSGLSMEFEYDAASELYVLVLSVECVSARLTWPERTLLMHAVRDLAWRMFQ
jgi:predicted secreted protein